MASSDVAGLLKRSRGFAAPADVHRDLPGAVFSSAARRDSGSKTTGIKVYGDDEEGGPGIGGNMTMLAPDVIVRVRLFLAEEGGRQSPLPVKQFGCPLFFKGEGFDCRLLLDQLGSELRPGQTADVPVKFLFPEHIKPRLRVGDRFKLWDGNDFAEGEVLEVR